MGHLGDRHTSSFSFILLLCFVWLPFPRLSYNPRQFLDLQPVCMYFSQQEGGRRADRETIAVSKGRFLEATEDTHSCLFSQNLIALPHLVTREAKNVVFIWGRGNLNSAKNWSIHLDKEEMEIVGYS